MIQLTILLILWMVHTILNHKYSKPIYRQKLPLTLLNIVLLEKEIFKPIHIIFWAQKLDENKVVLALSRSKHQISCPIAAFITWEDLSLVNSSFGIW